MGRLVRCGFPPRLTDREVMAKDLRHVFSGPLLLRLLGAAVRAVRGDGYGRGADPDRGGVGVVGDGAARDADEGAGARHGRGELVRGADVYGAVHAALAGFAAA